MVEFFRTYRQRRAAWVIPLLHWLLLAAATVVLMHWLTLPQAIAAGAMSLLCIGGGVVWQRRPANRAWAAIILPTAALVLALQTLLFPVFAGSQYARSEMRPLAERIWRAAPDATVYSLSPHPPVRHVPLELMIYLNRVAELLPGPEALESLPPPGPHVLLIHQRRDRDRPEPPAGWTYLDEVPHDRNRWIAFTDVTGH